MTPLNPQAPQNPQSGFVGGLTIGLAICAVVLCLGSGVGYVIVKRAGENARKGWNLQPVIVSTVDLSVGTTVTMEMISQRSVPEQFASSSVIKPDSASYVVNQKILVPVQAGDPLLWSQFETKKQPLALFARNDIPAGVAVSLDAVDEKPVPESLLTPSWVRSEDRPQALGRTVLAPFRKGDPIMWTHLAPAGTK